MPLRFLRIPKRLVGGEIQKYDMIFSPDVVRVVAILEVLQNYDRVEDLNESQFKKLCDEFAGQ